MLDKFYLHQNGIESNFMFREMASVPAIGLRINPRIHEDSKGVFLMGCLTMLCIICFSVIKSTGKCSKCRLHMLV